METYIAYFDETGDDGVTTASSDSFVLTSLYMSADAWQSNYNKMKAIRSELTLIFSTNKRRTEERTESEARKNLNTSPL